MFMNTIKGSQSTHLRQNRNSTAHTSKRDQHIFSLEFFRVVYRPSTCTRYPSILNMWVIQLQWVYWLFEFEDLNVLCVMQTWYGLKTYQVDCMTI